MPRSEFLKVTQSFSDLAFKLGYFCIYFVQEEKPSDETPCKVGMTNRLLQRKIELQIGNPRQIGYSEIIFIPRFRVRATSHDFGYDYVSAKVARRMKINKALHTAVPQSDIVNPEKTVHDAITEFRIRGEWYNGGVGMLVERARQALDDGFPGNPHYLDAEAMKRIRHTKDEVMLAASC